MKKILILFLVIPLVFAECDRVIIANFNYDNQVITYREQIAKCGYYPDRRIQPSGGYIAEVVGDEGVLYNFRFEIPLRVYVDASDPVTDGLSGGVVMLNETDFALIFPYFDNMKEIVIYNPRGYEVTRLAIEKELFAEQKSIYWAFGFFGLFFLAIYLIFRHYKPAKNL